MTVPTLLSVPVSQFYYSGVIGDLVIGQAHNAVSNGVRKQLEEGNFVLNYAQDRDSGRFFAQVGVATGEVLPTTAQELWPTWCKDNPVFAVRWLTSQVEVPSELFVNQRQGLPNEDVRNVISYVLLG